VTWHPDHHSSHPHPNSSPDGTKSLFNVELLGQYTNIYVGVNRFPDPPQELKARSDGTDVILTWKKPRRSLETRGYHVYGSDQSGVKYHRLTTEPVTGTEWRVPLVEPDGYYVVTAAEYSGLESRASNEVFGKGNENWQGPVRLAIEAEASEATGPEVWTESDPTSSKRMRAFVDQRTASDGYYVACPDEVTDGWRMVKVTVSKNALYYLWARVKGDGSLTAGLRTRSWGHIQCHSQEWAWQKAQAAVELTTGEYEVMVQSTTGSECLDKVLLTDDTAFVPEGMLLLDRTVPHAPTNLTAHTLRPNAIKLMWSPVQATDIDHFNVYCSANADFACEQVSLVGSPSETEFVDWGLKLNTGYWYKVTAVDRAGNESVPTTAVQADTVAFEPVRIELTRDNASLEHMRVIWIEAAGGKVLEPTAGQRGTAAWEFTIPRAGEYAIWGLSTHRENESSIFDVFLDEQAPVTWRVYGQWDKWLWSPAGNMITGSPQLFTLTASEHTLRVRTKTPTSSLAKIVITDDPTWWPVEGMKK
jgi:fibronectin type 3 domain-containing protein